MCRCIDMNAPFYYDAVGQPIPHVRPNSRTLLCPFGQSYSWSEYFALGNPDKNVYDDFYDEEPCGEMVAMPMTMVPGLLNAFYWVMVYLAVCGPLLCWLIA